MKTTQTFQKVFSIVWFALDPLAKSQLQVGDLVALSNIAFTRFFNS